MILETVFYSKSFVFPFIQTYYTCPFQWEISYSELKYHTSISRHSKNSYYNETEDKQTIQTDEHFPIFMRKVKNGHIKILWKTLLHC